MAAGRDGNVWFVDNGQRAVGRISQSGAITEFSVPGTGGGPEAITTGPDGNIWMVAGSVGTGRSDWVLRVGRAGEVVSFPVLGVPGPNGNRPGLDGIAAGPDGNIWFTEFFVDRIGRLTPAGVLSEFALRPNSAPRGIVAGPDGNLWFAESNLNRPAIARIRPTGEVVEYPLVGGSMDNQLNPTALVAGPDGNVWFTELGKIGRITPEGQITEFPIAGADQPGGLAAGPDGNVWFTSHGGNSVGRISPSGAIRQFALVRPNADPLGMAAGSDGRLWFTEAGVSRIASMGFTVPEVTLNARLLTFGSASQPGTQAVTVANTGDGVLKIASVTVVGPDPNAFQITSDGCSGRSVTVSAHCQVSVAFMPGSNPGLRAARLQVTDNGTGSPQTVSMVAQLTDCLLPVTVVSTSPTAAQGKFLRLSTGAATDDPKAGFDFVADRNLYGSRAEPILYGPSPATYDQALGRWLPVGRGAISPGGSRYVYTVFNGTMPSQLHVVDVATGRDTPVNLADGFWSVLDFAPEGIYVDQRYEGIGPGLWLVDPATGSMRQVFADGVVGAVADGAAWIEVLNPQDPSPPTPYGMGIQVDNQMVKRDLATGATTTWLYRPGEGVHVLAAEGGTVLVEAIDNAQMPSFWIVSGPNQAERVTVPETGEAFSYAGGMVFDSAGVWLSGADGIYLWTARTGDVLVWGGAGRPSGKCA